MKNLLILGVLSVCAAAQGIVLEGTTTHALTHEPLPGVHVLLVQNPGTTSDSVRTFGAISDRSGHFRVGGLAPGPCLLMPELPGFIFGQKRSGGIPIPSVQVKAVANDPLNIEMTPRGVIIGRVLDTSGDPLPGAMVQLHPLDTTMVVADPSTDNDNPLTHTDDRGIFRTSGMPGRYYVEASNREGHAFYPSASTKETATVVELRPGAETAGVEIRMGGVTRPAGFVISGRVLGGTAAQDKPGMAMMRSRGLVDFHADAVVVGKDGAFQYKPLPPGEYEVWATEGELTSVPVPVTLTSADVGGLELRLLPGRDISGRLVVAGDPPGLVQGKWRIQLAAAGMLPQRIAPQVVEVDSSGAFRFTNVPPLAMQISLVQPPEGAYLRSAVLDGVSMDRQRVLTLTGRDTLLEVTVGRKGAVISGSVTDSEGKPLENPMGVVLLMGDPTRPDLLDHAREQVEISPKGMFEFKAVAPGRYRMVAVDILRSGLGPDGLVKAAAAQPEFEVKEGEHITIQVKLAVREGGDAKK